MPGKLILVVDDNEVAREGLAVILRGAGYDVEVAGNGQRALDLMRDGLRPDLILLDMLMPVVDGWQFLQRFRQDGPQPPPVLVITSTILTREWALDHGCLGFLRKPLEPEALLEEVRRCLAAEGG